MKIVKYSIGALLVLYFQILVAPKLSIFGIVPFFILPFIIFISMNLKFIESATIAFIIGLAIDLINPYLLGLNSVLLLIMTLLVTKYHSSVTKDKLGPVIISILLINLTYMVPYFFLKGIILGYEMVLLGLFPLELFYNSAITLIFIMLLNIIQKLKVVIDV